MLRRYRGLNRFLEAMARPERLAELSLDEWDVLLREGFAIDALARLSYRVEERAIERRCPPDAIAILRGARHQPEFVQTRVLWEARHVRRVLHGVCEPVLLKGAAYAAAGLNVGRGRLTSDLDVLVPRERLDAVEAQLCRAGYQQKALDAYDERYYREWMHELPPYLHPERGIELDIHHTLLPPVGRLHPRPDLLFAAARSVPDGFRVLAPTDMVLNCAAHLYQGEVRDGQRDLLDLLSMLEDFGADADFWPELAERAATHDLCRPLFFALALCRLLLGCVVPERHWEALRRCGARARWDGLLFPFARTLLEGFGPGRRQPWLARQVLLARSHVVKMPPGLLVKHLIRKSLAGKKTAGN